MNHTVTVRYTVDTIAPLARRAYWRMFGRVAVLLCIASAALFAWSAAPSRGGWFAGATGALFVVCIVVTLVGYQIAVLGRVELVRKMSKPEATFDFGQDAFSVAYGPMRLELPWIQLTKVWRYREGWLLFVQNSFYTLPLDGVSAEAQQFILERVRSAGGAID